MAELRYHGDIKNITNKNSDTCNAKDIKEVLNFLKKAYGKDCAKEAERMLIVVNGTSIQLKDGFKTKLSDSDTVSFLPVCGGG